MPAEIDWPLTLTLVGVIIGGLGLIAGTVAAVYSVLAFRIQERQDRASVTNIPVSEEELTILRFVDRDGPLPRGFYNVGQQSVSAWRLRTSGQHIVGDPRNSWFLRTVDELKARELVARGPGDGLKLTQEGRSVVRRDAHRPIAVQRSLILWDEPSQTEQNLPVS
jgi:hypothetical protein